MYPSIYLPSYLFTVYSPMYTVTHRLSVSPTTHHLKTHRRAPGGAGEQGGGKGGGLRDVMGSEALLSNSPPQLRPQGAWSECDPVSVNSAAKCISWKREVFSDEERKLHGTESTCTSAFGKGEGVSSRPRLERAQSQARGQSGECGWWGAAGIKARLRCEESQRKSAISHPTCGSLT